MASCDHNDGMATKVVDTQRDLSLYEVDFYRWTELMSARLRARDVDELDWDNLAEEIESLGGSQRREVKSRLLVLVAHLLKWKHQPELRDGSTWRATINDQRIRIQLDLDDSPSLKSLTREALLWAYPRAVRLAIDEMRLDKSPFPKDCPYSLADILRDDFFPD
jgi:hypothetical protein